MISRMTHLALVVLFFSPGGLMEKGHRPSVRQEKAHDEMVVDLCARE